MEPGTLGCFKARFSIDFSSPKAIANNQRFFELSKIDENCRLNRPIGTQGRILEQKTSAERVRLQGIRPAKLISSLPRSPPHRQKRAQGEPELTRIGLQNYFFCFRVQQFLACLFHHFFDFGRIRAPMLAPLWYNFLYFLHVIFQHRFCIDVRLFLLRTFACTQRSCSL